MGNEPVLISGWPKIGRLKELISFSARQHASQFRWNMDASGLKNLLMLAYIHEEH
jgi:hypothetical protein